MHDYTKLVLRILEHNFKLPRKILQDDAAKSAVDRLSKGVEGAIWIQLLHAAISGDFWDQKDGVSSP